MLLFIPLLHRGIDERCEQRLRRHEYKSFSPSVNAPYGFDTSTSSFPTNTSPKIYSGSSRRTTGPIIDPVTGVELVGKTLPSLCPHQWLSHHRKQRKLTELTKNQSFTSTLNPKACLPRCELSLSLCNEGISNAWWCASLAWKSGRQGLR